jgi:hypothetical protein
MLLGLGRGFRKKARKGGATAFVVNGNKDGSLKLTESRVLEAGDLTTTLLRISVSWMVGFWGFALDPERRQGRGPLCSQAGIARRI